MLKRIGLIGFLTGIGQLISLVAIKLSSNYLPLKDIASIAQIDSLIVFIASILAAGLQSAAMRDIAIEQNWQLRYKQIQSARFSLSILLSSAGLFLFFKWEYAVFFLSPLIALNGDYALYALGQSVKGALIACIRLLIPYALLIISVLWAKDIVSYLFFLAWLVSYLFTDKIIANILQLNTVIKPVFSNLKLYIQSFPLGIAIISSNFLGIGVVLIIPFFYPGFIETIAFIGLKFYTIFKGVLRIIHQAFLKEMIEDKTCLKVDQISILLALCYVGTFIFFPRSFIFNFFGAPYVQGGHFFSSFRDFSNFLCFPPQFCN